MANTILVGAQWGDEGKGKIIDVLTEQARSSSAPRAATTPDTPFTSDLSIRPAPHPSGILRADKVCVIGNGVVLDPIGLVRSSTASTSST